MGKTAKFWTVSLLLVGLLGVLFYGGIELSDLGARQFNGKPLLAMTAISVGTLISEDLSTISAGLLAASEMLAYWQAVLAAFTGILIGDALIFWMGHHFGRPLLGHSWSRWLVSERSVDRAQKLFEEHGLWIVLATRFVPGTRTATYFSAGAVHAPVVPFIATFAFAALLWTPFLVGLSYLVGSKLMDYYHLYEAMVLPALIFTGLILYIFIHYGMPLLTWKGRRRLKGKWLAAVKWEYWPVWQVYWLVVAYILVVGIFRYRKPTLFTAVNPCMPDGGFIGESKRDILEGLSQAGDAMPAWALIDPGTPDERRLNFDKAMNLLNLSYPIVMKPDCGQRGAGVKVIRTRDEALKWLKDFNAAGILQEHVGGKEYGIFYMRKPSWKNGKITSITLKKQLFILGNGTDTIETLIYAHPRAIAKLDVFLERFKDRLDLVPDDGERISLGELGTHARGSLFLDGNHLISEPLCIEIQRISETYCGFYFGRYDVKAPGDDALMSGKGLKIIELNGVTSEETHIYDPRHGLFYAWKCLCRQWKAAFEIADENVSQGHAATSAYRLLKNIVSARRAQR